MSLAIGYTDLQKTVGHFLGYGRGIYGSTDESGEWQDIEDCINSGLRQFYSPPSVKLNGIDYLHQWSFLRPVTTLSLVSGTGDYDLPADFGGIIGRLTYPPSAVREPIVVAGESMIRQLRQRHSEKGCPTHAAVRPKSSDGSANQLYEILFWPEPNEAVDVEYKYFVHARRLSVDYPYPYGGPQHSETILESCLAVAENRINDQKGIHWDRFIERLSASIQHDRKIGGPDFFGYNGDNSAGSWQRDRTTEVTVNGSSID